MIIGFLHVAMSNLGGGTIPYPATAKPTAASSNPINMLNLMVKTLDSSSSALNPSLQTTFPLSARPRNSSFITTTTTTRFHRSGMPTTSVMLVPCIVIVCSQTDNIVPPPPPPPHSSTRPCLVQRREPEFRRLIYLERSSALGPFSPILQHYYYSWAPLTKVNNRCNY